MSKERYQNPAIGDQIKLRLLTYNSNNLADLSEITKVEIYHLDPTLVTDENPNGLRLVQTFDGNDVVAEATGTYRLDVTLQDSLYVIGKYYDVWTVKAMADQPSHHIDQVFEVYPNLWYSTPIPVVYDFDFKFQPNKLRKGSIQYIKVEIIPNVPTAGDLRQYYENLAIASDLSISMEMECGECVPAEEDLRLILDEVPTEYREKRFGFFKLDTTDMDCGVYNIWYKLLMGGNTYISDKYHFQIYE